MVAYTFIVFTLELNKREYIQIKNKFKIGQWVLLPLDEEPYQITKIYKKDNEEVIDLDDGDNFKLYAKPIGIIRAIPKKNI